MFLISRRNATTVLDPVEEPLDVISLAVGVWAEADRVSAIPARRDIRPAPTRIHKRSYLGRVVSLVGENYSAARQAFK